MKTLLRLSIAFFSIGISGCSSLPSSVPYAEITKILDGLLPPDFTGPLHVEHTNIYFDLTIDAEGLKRTEKGWTWTYLKTKRHDRFSSGGITLGTPPR